LHSAEAKERLRNFRDRCLGPVELRSREKPTRQGNKWIGGVHFERNFRAKPVKSNTRCYTVGNSYESPTKIQAPCATGKFEGDDDIEVIELRRDILQVLFFFIFFFFYILKYFL
jgi:hypothetical protein